MTRNDDNAVQCTLCNKLGRILDCCRDLTESCLTCDQFTQIGSQDTEKHHTELAALHDRIAQLEHEKPDREHDRLRDEKNAQLVALKADIEDVKEKEKQLNKDSKNGEIKLSKLEAELRGLQPKKKDEAPQEFFIRTTKLKKGKKKNAYGGLAVGYSDR